MDSTSQSGFFSSGRLGSDDIFMFRYEELKFSSCDTVQETNYCFTFYDERYALIDTLPVIYRWDFGQGYSSYRFRSAPLFSGARQLYRKARYV